MSESYILDGNLCLIFLDWQRTEAKHGYIFFIQLTQNVIMGLCVRGDWLRDTGELCICMCFGIIGTLSHTA